MLVVDDNIDHLKMVATGLHHAGLDSHVTKPVDLDGFERMLVARP